MATLDRRYQVFISSTYMDLADERREVMQALLEMECMPAGMELFPAADESQWELIKDVIDQSDYYVVIVGGRYGSTGPSGLSFTEQEYDYAVASNKPVLGFVHANPTEIPSGKTEPQAQAELDSFLRKVKSRLVKAYSSPAELGSVVSRAMIRQIRQRPGEGWVRGSHAMTPEQESEFANLQAEVSDLRRQLESATEPDAELADGDDTYDFRLRLDYYSKDVGKSARIPANASKTVCTVALTWNQVLSQLGPTLLNEGSEDDISQSLRFVSMSELSARGLLPHDYAEFAGASIYPEDLGQTIVQLAALKLIKRGTKKRRTSDKNRYWVLTQRGESALIVLRAIKKPSSDV